MCIRDRVYAISDVNNPEEEGETRSEECVRPDFVEKLLEVARGELGYTEGAHSFTCLLYTSFISIYLLCLVVISSWYHAIHCISCPSMSAGSATCT